MPESPAYEVSVIICVRNGAATIRRQLDALNQQADAPPFEVVVVDNGSTDATAQIVGDWIAEGGPAAQHARLVDGGRTPGIPRARNRGASAATGRVLAFCDADDEVLRGWVAAMSRAVTEDELVGGRFYTVDTAGHPVTVGFGDGLIATPYLPHVGNSNCALARSTFNAVGGYDESLPRYGFEDVDLSWRVQEAGYPIAYAPDAEIRFTVSGDAASVKKKFLLGKGRVLMARRFPQYDSTRYTVGSTLADAGRLTGQIASALLRERTVSRQHLGLLVASAGRIAGAVEYDALGREPGRRDIASAPPQIAIAANNGDIGGGEVMLLQIADALRELGREPLVLGPSEPSGLVDAARERGFPTTSLPAAGRRGYMRALRRWRRANRALPLWCNGLVPSAATSGQGPRIVHLHILPRRAHAALAVAARIGARAVIVPSRFMAQHVPGARVLENWTGPIEQLAPKPAPSTGRDQRSEIARSQRSHDRVLRVGFLGRLTREKGVHVLAEAMQIVRRQLGDVRLLLAGENRFGSAEDDAAITAALAPLTAAVEQPGWMEPAEFFSSVDLAVFPSTVPESFGLVAAEAMAYGTPFVISDAGALPEVAGPDHPWVASAGNAEDLAQTIIAALTAPEQDRRAQIAASRSRWHDEFSPQAGVRRVAALLAFLERKGQQ